jgi:hypothetical protein
MRNEVFGAASEQALREMHIEIEGWYLPTNVECLPNGLWTVSTVFERARHDRFDIVFRFPPLNSDYGIELKEIAFQPIGKSAETLDG